MQNFVELGQSNEDYLQIQLQFFCTEAEKCASYTKNCLCSTRSSELGKAS